MKQMQICSRCVLDSTTPGIAFSSCGVCNYCDQFDRLCQDNPTGEAGRQRLEAIVVQQKKAGAGRKYDVLIGMSGGTDSTYLLHTAVLFGLRPLCVHLSNGWDTAISNENMARILKRHPVDMINVEVDPAGTTELIRCFMKAGLPWIDGPTDIAMVSTLYRLAKKHGIKYIWVGNNFRTEGRQPDEWTHLDSRLIAAVHRRFGTRSIGTFPNMTLWNMFDWWMLHGIKMIRPLNFLDYNKMEVKKFLMQEYGWQDYGGHHHENLFTKFSLAVWLYRKFGIDKRRVTFSACVRTGEMSREAALEELKSPPCSEAEMRHLTELVCARFGFSSEEFQSLMDGENKTFRDYPSYFPLYQRFRGIFNLILRVGVGFKPMMTYK